jgi:hypothetical protein
MKTRGYFTDKAKEIKSELKADIIERTKMFIGQTFLNDDESNKIGFFNHIADCEDSGLIDEIYFGENEITIYPQGNDLCETHLSDIEDIHDLMLIQFVVSGENFQFML